MIGSNLNDFPFWGDITLQALLNLNKERESDIYTESLQSQSQIIMDSE